MNNGKGEKALQDLKNATIVASNFDEVSNRKEDLYGKVEIQSRPVNNSNNNVNMNSLVSVPINRELSTSEHISSYLNGNNSAINTSTNISKSKNNSNDNSNRVDIGSQRDDTGVRRESYYNNSSSPENSVSVGNTMITLRKDGSILEIDQSTANLFGYSCLELIGKPFHWLFSSAYRRCPQQWIDFKALSQTETPLSGHQRVLEGQHRDGRVFLIRISLSRLCYVMPTYKAADRHQVIDTNNSRGIDISEAGLARNSENQSDPIDPCEGKGKDVHNSNTEEDNEQQSEYLCFMDELKDQGAVVTTDVNGDIVSCNTKVEQLFGYKVNELAGKKLNTLLASENILSENQSCEKKDPSTDEEGILVKNAIGIHKNGARFYVVIQMKPFRVGQFVLYCRKMEKVETDIECAFIVDRNDRVMSCSHVVLSLLFGFHEEEICGGRLSRLLPEMEHCTALLSHECRQPTCPTLVSISSSITCGVKRQKLQSCIPSTSSPDMVASIAETKEMQIGGRSENNTLLNTRAFHRDGSLVPVELSVCPFHDEYGENYWSIKMRRLPYQENTVDQATDEHSVRDYLLLEVIGRGSYGKVRRGMHQKTRKQVAIKVLYKTMMEQVEIDRAIREAEILRKLRHPHIVEFIEMIETDKKLFMVMEYVNGTDLMSFILKKGKLSEKESNRFFKQIVSALDYCHRQGVIHRDIKHSNILVDQHGDLKLIDFGLSNFFVQNGKLMASFCGTPAYAAPEMILGLQYSGPEVDLWSLGVVTYSMLTARFPFSNFGELLAGKFADPENASKECCQLLRTLLTVQANKRATLTDVLHHEWFLGSGSSLSSGKSSESP